MPNSDKYKEVFIYILSILIIVTIILLNYYKKQVYYILIDIENNNENIDNLNEELDNVNFKNKIKKNINTNSGIDEDLINVKFPNEIKEGDFEYLKYLSDCFDKNTTKDCTNKFSILIELQQFVFLNVDDSKDINIYNKSSFVKNEKVIKNLLNLPNNKYNENTDIDYTITNVKIINKLRNTPDNKLIYGEYEHYFVTAQIAIGILIILSSFIKKFNTVKIGLTLILFLIYL